MKASDLKGRAVVTLSDAARVGRIDDILFDTQYRQVLGFRIKKGTFGHSEAVPRANVSSVGVDAVTVSSPAAINAEDRFSVLANATTLDKVDGTKIVTESGELLGEVADVELDDEARTVLSYALKSSPIAKWRGREPHISGPQVLRIGEGGIMIVPDAAANEVHPSQS